jgi:Lytic transglycolase
MSENAVDAFSSKSLWASSPPLAWPMPAGACGRSVVVTINDRGPAKWTGKVLDLSVGAARCVGITQRMGIGRITAVCA